MFNFISQPEIGSQPRIGRSFRAFIQLFTLAASLLLYASIVQADSINLNTANSEALQAIPGIGEKKATAIIDYREQHGKFKTVDELINVSGIGNTTLDQIKPYLTIKGKVSKRTKKKQNLSLLQQTTVVSA